MADEQITPEGFVIPNLAPPPPSALMETPAPLQVEQPYAMQPDYLAGQIGSPADIQAQQALLAQQVSPPVAAPPTGFNMTAPQNILPNGTGEALQINQQSPGPPQGPVSGTAEQQFAGQSGYLMDQEKAANSALAKAGQDKAAYEAGISEKLLAASKLDAIAQKAQAEVRKSEVESKLADLSNIQKEYRESLGQKINPNNYWENKDTGQKVMSGIALFLGGLAGGMNRTGGNVALDMVNKAIDRDIDAQKNNIQNLQSGKLKEADMQNNLVAQMYRKFGNEDQAIAAAKSLRLEQFQYMLNSNASKFQSKEIEQRLNLANLGIDQKKADLNYKIAAVENDKLRQLQLGEYLYGPTARNLDPRVLAAAPKEYQDKYVPGYGPAANKQAAEEFAKVRQPIDTALSAVNRIQELTKKFNNLSASPENLELRARMGLELQGLVGNLRLPFTGPGILTETEKTQLLEALGDPRKIITLPYLQNAKMEQTKTKLSSDLNDYAMQAGLPTYFSKPASGINFKPGQ